MGTEHSKKSNTNTHDDPIIIPEWVGQQSNSSTNPVVYLDISVEELRKLL